MSDTSKVETSIDDSMEVTLDVSEEVSSTPFEGVIFSFQKSVEASYGAKIRDVCLAYHYAKRNNKPLFLIEGEPWHAIVGLDEEAHRKLVDSSSEPLFKTTRNGWHYAFRSLPDVVSSEVALANPKHVWPELAYGALNSDPPEGYKGMKMGWYHSLMKALFDIHPTLKAQIDGAVLASGCKSSDIVLHLRWTNKLFPAPKTTPESSNVDLEWYLDEIHSILSTTELLNSKVTPRIFVCTDDKKALKMVRSALKIYDVEVEWDRDETRRDSFTSALFSYEVTPAVALEEFFTFLKNVLIMTTASDLVGARYSHTFQVADLLRYPKPTYNVKDSDVRGKAVYLSSVIPTVRPSKLRACPRFVSKELMSSKLKVAKATLAREGIVEIPNFLDFNTAEEIHTSLSQIPEGWFSRAIKFSDETKYITLGEEDQSLIEYARQAKEWMLEGGFAYNFARSIGKHFDTCPCAVCKLEDSANSYQFLDTLAKITDDTVLATRETFLGKYDEGSFLSIHHDQTKGEYGFVLNLTKEWKCTYGGLLNFCDEHGKVYHVESPAFNSLLIFNIPEDHTVRRDHFVSEVVVPRTKWSFTGWF